MRIGMETTAISCWENTCCMHQMSFTIVLNLAIKTVQNRCIKKYIT